jgi:hypothetical protein
VSDIPIHERKFSDQEVREILKRAVERAPSRALVKQEGFSLAELKAISAEVGIDPARVEDAARAVALKGVNRKVRILGAPTTLNFERKAEGTFDPEDIPEVLTTIRRVMGQQGEANEIRGSLEWSAKGDSGERFVTISSRDGTTSIQGSANLSNAALLTFLPGGIIGLITSLIGLGKFIEDGAVAGLVVFLVLVPTLYAVLRTMLSRYVHSESAKLQKVVEDLARLTEGSGE